VKDEWLIDPTTTSNADKQPQSSPQHQSLRAFLPTVIPFFLLNKNKACVMASCEIMTASFLGCNE
jgi:hypothetical protein